MDIVLQIMSLKLAMCCFRYYRRIFLGKTGKLPVHSPQIIADYSLKWIRWGLDIEPRTKTIIQKEKVL